MYGLLNVGSLLLGLIAWFLPAVSLTKRGKQGEKKRMLFSIASLGACAVSLCFQIFYHYHLVIIEDWAAIADITRSTAIAAAFLLIVTILLSTAVPLRNRARTVSPQ